MAESQLVFEGMNSAADPRQVQEWKKQEEIAQARRDVDPEAMDIYDFKASPSKREFVFLSRSELIAVSVKTKAMVHKELLEEDESSAGAQVCGLIAEALKIEEQQCVFF